MKLRYLVALASATLLISLLFLRITLFQANMEAITETRKSALITCLSRNQLDNGAYTSFMFPSNDNGSNQDGVYETAQALCALEIFDSCKKVDVDKALSFIISNQNVTVGNQTLWSFPGHILNASGMYINSLYVPYVVICSLKPIGALDSLNKTALINIALDRYNKSDGAFHEPIIQGPYKRNYTVCGFPLHYGYNSLLADVAYARSNVISTFLGVNILAELDVLDRINVTKTLDWVLSCKAENGAFKPFPGSLPGSLLPHWSRYQTNPFYVDRYGTGIAFTYAALGTLKALGELNNLTLLDREKIKDYALACQKDFYDVVVVQAHPDDTRSTYAECYAFYAIMSLYYVDLLEAAGEFVSKVVEYLLEWVQNLRFPDVWPVPPISSRSYGLFWNFPPMETTYFSVKILNMTGKLFLLDEPTPRANTARTNLTILTIVTSMAIAAATIITIVMILIIRKKNNRKTHDVPEAI